MGAPLGDVATPAVAAGGGDGAMGVVCVGLHAMDVWDDGGRGPEGTGQVVGYSPRRLGPPAAAAFLASAAACAAAAICAFFSGFALGWYLFSGQLRQCSCRGTMAGGWWKMTFCMQIYSGHLTKCIRLVLGWMSDTYFVGGPSHRW